VVAFVAWGAGEEDGGDRNQAVVFVEEAGRHKAGSSEEGVGSSHVQGVAYPCQEGASPSLGVASPSLAVAYPSLGEEAL